LVSMVIEDHGRVVVYLFVYLYHWLSFKLIYVINLWSRDCRLEIQRDENEALKAALQSTLKAKEDDLKMYMDTIEETKSVFLRGIQQIRANPSQA